MAFNPFQAPLQAKYGITGPDCQILSINLAPGEHVDSEPGSMMYMSPDIRTKIRCGSCTRCFTGESCWVTTFENQSTNPGYIALTPNFPAKVVPIDLKSRKGNTIIVKPGAYMAHALGDAKVVANLDCCSCTCCCGGMGAIRQQITGDATVFLSAGGTIVTKELAPNETIIIDDTSVVGFEEGVKLGVRTAGGCCVMCCGGEGLFNTTLTGPGLAIIQSMSFEKYKHALVPPPHQQVQY